MVQVTVAQGILEGESRTNEYGGSYYSFKGIPYAEPPVGDLRFKAPQPLKPWSGVRSAKEFGPISYQIGIFIPGGGPQGSEDCLYLNVYTPEIKPSSPLPVMVFIHGGGFVRGSGNDDKYGPGFLVKENIILVTLNYRVDILGFLSLETEDIPGNAGLKDQVAALRWVKTNISNFGGDPNNITIFGESAGAVSVVYHLISPMTKGLFKRAIAQSGAATCGWAKSFEPRERAIAFAKKLGCDSEDLAEVTRFYMSQPKEKLVEMKVPITFTEAARLSINIQVGVVSEKEFGDNERFFYGDVHEAMRNGIHEGVDVIAGYNQDEGLIGLFGKFELPDLIEQANNFKEMFAPREITLNCSVRDALESGRKIKKFYFKNQKVSMENFDELLKFFGMDMFNFQIIQFLKIIASKNKSYLYKFIINSDLNYIARIAGLEKHFGNKKFVSHADDLAYLFTSTANEVDKNSENYKLINNVVKLWTNFAKFGNPTPDNSLEVQWPVFTAAEQQYLEIGNKLVNGTAPDKDQMEFWEAIFKEYCPHLTA